MATNTVTSDSGGATFQIDTYVVNNIGQCDRPPLPEGMPMSKLVGEMLDDLHDGPWEKIDFQYINGKLVNWTVVWNKDVLKYNPNCIAYWKHWRKQLEKTHHLKYAVVLNAEDKALIFDNKKDAISQLAKNPGAYMHCVGSNCACITSVM